MGGGYACWVLGDQTGQTEDYERIIWLTRHVPQHRVTNEGNHVGIWKEAERGGVAKDGGWREAPDDNDPTGEHIADQERDIIHWRTCFSQLVVLANGAIEDVPRMLREADSSLMFFNFPDSVQTFLNHCKYLVERMKVMIARSRDWFCFVLVRYIVLWYQTVFFSYQYKYRSNFHGCVRNFHNYCINNVHIYIFFHSIHFAFLFNFLIIKKT